MPDLQDLTGKRFGALQVIGRVKNSPSASIRWDAKCDCGKASQPLGVNLRTGRATTCGCKMLSRTTFADTKTCARCKIEKSHSFFCAVSDTKLAPYCDPCANEKKREQYRADPEPRIASNRKANADLKLETLGAYGGHCSCCGEGDPVFLAIDHLHGGGTAHRREIGNKGGIRFYRWLKNHSFPAGYGVLCHNCNWAKFRTGDCCPHKQPSWMPAPMGGGPFLCIGG